MHLSRNNSISFKFLFICTHIVFLNANLSDEINYDVDQQQPKPHHHVLPQILTANFSILTTPVPPYANDSTNNKLHTNSISQLQAPLTSTITSTSSSTSGVEKLCNDTHTPLFVSNSASTHLFNHQSAHANVICQPIKQSCSKWGACSQKCIQLNDRNLQCECLPGYYLTDDKFTCKSLSEAKPLVIFSIRTEIKSYELESKSDHQRPRPLISGLRNSIALDFYYADPVGYIFWTDVAEERIYKGTFIDNTLMNVDSVIHGGLSTAEGLAVDWIGQNIYWVESTIDQIEVANFNGTFRRTLIAGDMESPRAISVDPRYGYIFWTDWDKKDPRIERATMSGEDRRVIVHVKDVNNGSWPNGLTLDYENLRLYWVDASSDSIYSVDYSGNDAQLILMSVKSLGHPFSISLFENNIYWTDWRTTSVSMANKFNGANLKEIQRTSARPFDLKVYHPDRQPKIDVRLNPCHYNNGNCSQLCLLAPNHTRRCECSYLMTLANDKRTCISNEKVLLIGRSNEIRVVDVNEPLYHIIPPISVPKIVSPKQFEFDVKTRRVYWLDDQLHDIKRAQLMGGSIETIIDAIIESPSAMAIDWISRNIYVTSSNSNIPKIYISNLDGEFISVLLDSSDKIQSPKALAVQPILGLLFMIDEDISNEPTTKPSFVIVASGMDGSNRRIISSISVNPKLENPTNLVIDYDSNRVYWINLGERAGNSSVSIQYYDIMENKVLTIWDDSKVPSEERINPSVLCIDGDSLIFNSRRESEHLVRAKADNLLNRTILRSQNAEEILSLKLYNSTAQYGTNGCSKNNGGCSQLCVPSNSTHKVCKCTIGYHINQTKDTECIGQDQFLIFSYNWGMKGVSLEPNSSPDELYLAPIHKAFKASSIDFVHKENLIYWVDNEEGSITRINRDTTGHKVIVQNLESEESIAIDWVAGNIYWLDPYYDIIEVARLNGSNRYVIVSGDMDKANGIVVNPLKGYIAWSDSGIVSKIEVALLDGSNRSVIVNTSLSHINDLAIDYEENYIYWLDSAAAVIEKVRPDGSGRQQVYSISASPIFHPVGIAVYKSYIYVADSVYYSGSIVRYNKNDLLTKAILQHDLGDGIKDIAIFAEQPIPSASLNPCARDNGGCKDLCLFLGVPGSRKCICSHGRLVEDGVSCKPYDTFVIYSRSQQIDSIHIKDDEALSNTPYPPIAYENRSTIISLTLDYPSSRVIYSEKSQDDGKIYSIFFNGTGQKVLVDKQGFVEGVSFIDNQLFWTSISDYSISRLNISSSGVHMKKCTDETECVASQVEKLIKLTSEDKPRGIAVDKCTSYIYWTNWRNNNPSIQRASPRKNYLPESIITSAIKVPNGIAIDHQQRKLYWCDAGLDKIEYCEMDGRNRVVLLQQFPQHPFALSVWENYVVWTDWQVRGVFKADKYTGQNPTQIKKIIQRPMGIVVATPDNHECVIDKCSVNNGGCPEGLICVREGLCSIDERYLSTNLNLPIFYSKHCNHSLGVPCDLQLPFLDVANNRWDLRDLINSTSIMKKSDETKKSIDNILNVTQKIHTVMTTPSHKSNEPSTEAATKTPATFYETTFFESTRPEQSTIESSPAISNVTQTTTPSPCKSDGSATSTSISTPSLTSKSYNPKNDSNWHQFLIVLLIILSASIAALLLVFGNRSKRRWLGGYNNGFSHRRFFDDTATNIEISNPMFDEDDAGNVLQCPFSIDLNERSTNFTNPLLIVGSRRKF